MPTNPRLSVNSVMGKPLGFGYGRAAIFAGPETNPPCVAARVALTFCATRFPTLRLPVRTNLFSINFADFGAKVNLCLLVAVSNSPAKVLSFCRAKIEYSLAEGFGPGAVLADGSLFG